jgi:parallel beta-helix repeat protein
VVHGSVREFSVGVDVVGARHNRLLGISSSRNGFIGIEVDASARSVIRNSSGSGSPNPKEGGGLFLLSSRHVRILHNSFRHNAHNGIIIVGSNNNLIKGNVFSRNDDEGVLMFGGERNRVTRNRFVRNGAGITDLSSHNVIKRNRVSRGRVGIRIDEGNGNLVAHNVVAHTLRAGIRLGITKPRNGRPHPPFSAHNVVRRNLVRGSRGDGFVVAKSDRHGHLKRNISVGARDDGFDVEGRRSKLTRNEARRNGDLGIEAVRGVIDGGGNRASGNGDPRQCINVVCR